MELTLTKEQKEKLCELISSKFTLLRKVKNAKMGDVLDEVEMLYLINAIPEGEENGRERN